MSSVINNQNLDAHYTMYSKIERKPQVINPSIEKLPEVRLWDDEKANIKIKTINKDIYENTKKKKKNFWF